MKLFFGNKKKQEDFSENSENRYSIGIEEFLTGSKKRYYSSNILSIPSVWAAVDFLSGTMASLPIRIYNKRDDSPISDGREYNILNISPAYGQTSYDWRYYMFRQLLVYGQSFVYIERSPDSRIPLRLHWLIDPRQMKRQLNGTELEYHYNDNGRLRVYDPMDIIDLVWMRDFDGLSAIEPIKKHEDVFQLAFAFEEYQRTYASTGGIPPFAAKGRWADQNASKKSLINILTAIREAVRRGEPVVPLAKDIEITPLGIAPERGRINETQSFIVRQICRIYGIPPAFLHESTGISYNSAEMQALTLDKYTLNKWATQLEQQLSLKFLGNSRYCKHDLDELLRGDYNSRVAGHSTAISSGQLTINEARKLEGRPSKPGGDKLFIQSGNQPVESLINEDSQEEINNNE